VASQAIGIDIGVHAVKVAQLQKKGGMTRAVRLFRAPLEGDTDAVRIQGALKRAGITGGPGLVGITGRDLIVRYTHVPPVPDWRLKLLMQFEINEVSGQSGGEVASDYRRIHLPVERVRAVLKMAQQPISLQAPVGDSEETSLGDFIEDKGAENPSDMTSMNLLKDKIKDVLDTLTERERAVLEQRFGLVDGYSRTLEEVGRQFQVTRERIRQIEAKALRKMRHPTRIRHLEGFLEAASA